MMAKKTKKHTPSKEAQHLVSEYKRLMEIKKWKKENLICFHEKLNKYPSYFRK